MAMALAMPMSVAPCFHCCSRGFLFQTRQRRRSSQKRFRHAAIGRLEHNLAAGDVDSNPDGRRFMEFAVPAACAAAAAVAFLGADAAAAAATAGVSRAFMLADLDPGVARVLLNVLGPVFASFNLLFIVRIVMSWYPKIPVDKLPFVLAYAPTEPVLAPTRRLIPPIGGVDVAPVVWVAILSLANEVLLGQQGLLVLLSEQQS